MAVIFPDVETTLVSYFNTALAGQNVRVGTKKAQPDEGPYPKELVIIVAYNDEVQYVTKRATVTLDVFADNYASASTLALLVESLIRGSVGEQIKRVTVRLGPVRTNEEGEQERRSIDVELVVKGSDV
jgi:hypothetical protein